MALSLDFSGAVPLPDTGVHQQPKPPKLDFSGAVPIDSLEGDALQSALKDADIQRQHAQEKQQTAQTAFSTVKAKGLDFSGAVPLPTKPVTAPVTKPITPIPGPGTLTPRIAQQLSPPKGKTVDNSMLVQPSTRSVLGIAPPVGQQLGETTQETYQTPQSKNIKVLPGEMYAPPAKENVVDQQWRQANEPEIAKQTEAMRKIIREQGGPKWINEFAAKGVAGIGAQAASLPAWMYNPALGLAGVLAGKDANGSDRLRIMSEATRRAAEAEGVGRNRASKFAQNIFGGLISSTPALIAMSAGVPAPVAFGAQAAAEARGQGGSASQAIQAAASGAKQGLAWEIPAAKGVIPKMATVGTGMAAADIGEGKPLGQVAESAVTNAFMAGGGQLLHGTVPERPETISTQMDALRNGTKDAVLITPGTPRPPVPPGFRTASTSEGVFIFDPKVVSESEIRSAVKTGTHGQILGNVAEKPELGEPTATVTAQTPEGEARTAVVPPEAAPAQADVLQNEYPQADVRVGGNEMAQDVLDKRLEPPQKVNNAGAMYTPEESARADALMAYQKPIVDALDADGLDRLAAKLDMKRSGQTDAQLRERIIDYTHPDDLQDALSSQAETTGGATTSGEVVPEAQPAPEPARGIEPPTVSATELPTGAAQTAPLPEEVKAEENLGIPPAESKATPELTAEPTGPEPTTGIAHRVETAVRGEEPARGQSIGAQESVERGRQLLQAGKDPQDAIDNFNKSGAISAESMALVRAKHEELARVANQAFDKGGLNSPEFKAAEKARQDFYDSAVKPMQTAWSNTGRAQQGETGIDTGTFYGLYRAFKDSHAREPTPKEQVVLQNLSARSAKTESTVQDLSGQLTAELNKAAGIRDLPPEVQQAVKRFIDQSARETRRTGRQQTRKSLDDEAAVIKQNLAAAFQKVKSQTGTQPSGLARIDPEGEITKQLIAYAKNRAKAGVTDAAQLIDDVHSTVKDFADVTKREVAEAILGAGLPKTERTESEWAKLKSGVRQEVKDYTTKEAREGLGARLQGGKKVSPQDAAEVWKYARENYIDKGNNDFADVTQKVASDLGITPDQVRRSLASTTATKRISDEMWKQMSDRRQAKQNAESWVKQADAPSYVKAFENARRLWFLKATVGHGAVAPFTHAPANAFIPSRWGDFWRNFGRTYQFMVSKGGHEQAMVDLENSPNFSMARRGGLANDPKRGYDEYQSPWMGKALGKLGISGNRAFDSLKTMRQDMFDSAWKGMTDDLKTPEMVKALSEEINASTGASKALSGKDWPSRFVSKAMFAAPLEASRWDFLVRDNYRAMKAFTNWKGATPAERYMAKRVASRNAQLVATYGSLLAANQGLLSVTGSKDKLNVTDPTKADFLAFKVGGKVISPAGGLLTAIRFMGNLAHIGLEDKKPREKASDAASVTFKYGRSKLDPLFGTGADIWLQSDYMGRPLPFSKQEGSKFAPRYTWPEYVWSTQTPIPLAESARVYYAERQKGASKLGAVASAAPVGAIAATGIRVREDFAQRIDSIFGAGESKARDEIQKIGYKLQPAMKAKDETPEQFKERESIENPLIKRTIEATVALPNYQGASAADKIEYLKRARQQAAQRAKDQLEELHPEREEERDKKKELKEQKAEENPLPDISSLRVPRGLRRPTSPFKQRFIGA